MSDTIKTDVLIVGAGPVGLFAVFELGLLDVRAHLVDILGMPGGQCAELYPEKPIYDIPGLPDRHRPGARRQSPGTVPAFRAAVSPRRNGGVARERSARPESPLFRITTDAGTCFEAKAVLIAAGGGSFQPKKPPIAGIEAYREHLRVLRGAEDGGIRRQARA